MRRGWEGTVDTIYENEDEDSSTASASSLPGPSLSSSQSPLQSIVQAWSVARGRKADVSIHVEGSCFHLHKEPLTSRSGYLKRVLTEASEITLSPPLNISAETFAVITNFCYGIGVVLTPFNIAALRTAAELLQMADGDDGSADNLRELTETYFCRAVALNQEYAAIIFRSCLTLLPEAEETASLASRCIEALCMTEEGDGVTQSLDDVAMLSPENFQLIANSMHVRFDENHDMLYEIVDHYLKEQKGKVTEERRIQICNSIDCDKLSPQFLMHAVQNPRMPLRFVVRAMLIEQLNTRRTIFSAAAAADTRPRRVLKGSDAVTLGAILQRDAALRQVAHLKVAMDATSSRIQSLERDLSGMKKLLRVSEARRSKLEPGTRSASFRVVSSTNKVERGERGSVSSVCHRGGGGGGRESVAGNSFGAAAEGCGENAEPRGERKLGRRLLDGLRSAFGLSSAKRLDERKSAGKLNELA